MKALDLSVAALIGFSSIASMAAWNPNQLSAEGRLYTEQASLQDYLLTAVGDLGLPWLQRASPGAICAALVPFSNSSLQVSARGRYFVCTTGPPPGVPMASVTIQLAGGNLTLQAWQLGKG
ncbi:MAG: hypothetical protein JRM80_02885 [Nitrososphaerota archaeon]|nr:hypothetical protein [Nitrososphaerota archaeon]